jgi:twitching motility protein PilI
MEKKQKLRELQTRLAEKLRAVRSGDVTASAAWLAVQAGEEKYLFPLNQSGEIFPWTTTQLVAHTQGWYLGVTNLRGSLYGVVDFSDFITGQQLSARMNQNRLSSRYVTFNSDLNINCALAVDSLDGLRSTESFKESREPAAGSPEFFGHVYIDESGSSWQEINLQALAQQNNFLNINA